MGSRHVTYCRNCASNCGMILEVEGDQIVSVENDRENPVSQGYVCIKGQMSVDLHNGAEGRLVECLKRDEGGVLRPIDKHQAIDEIGDKLSSILERHGPRSLAMFFGTTSYLDSVGKPFARSLMSEIGSPNIFSSMTVDQSAKWVTAGRMGAFASGRPSLAYTDVVLLAGNNPLVSHQGYPMTPIPTMNVNLQVRNAKKRGVKFIVVDPRRTEIARFADVFIQPWPGHDAEILAALIRLVLKNSWHNAAFCDRYVGNLDQLRDAAAPFTPERVAAGAGVEATEIEAAARLLGGAAKPCVGSGTGHNMAAHSNTSEHLSEALNAILGGYVLAGEIIPNPGIFAVRPGVEMVVPPNRTWERAPRCRTAAYGTLMGEFPASILPDEILAPGEEKIRAMIVDGANPAVCLSEPEKVYAALRDLELLVTFDPRMSATARLAHYVIAPALQFERAEVTSFTDYCFPWPFAQYTPAAKPPPPGVMGEWEFFWLLARRLGVELTLKYAPFGMDYKDAPGGLAVDMSVKPSREELIGWLTDQTRVSFETLKAHPHGYMAEVEATVLRAPDVDDGARLDLCPPDVFDEIGDVAIGMGLRPTEGLYLLTVRRVIESFNSMFQANPITQERHATNRLYMHPADLADLGAETDDAVEVRSRHGRVVAYLRADPMMKLGVVSMTHGWGAGPDPTPDPFGLRGAHTGRLVSISEDLQPINRMPLQSGIPVEIVKLGFDLEAAGAAAVREAVPGWDPPCA